MSDDKPVTTSDLVGKPTEEVKPIKYGALAKEYNLSFTDLKLAISSEFEIEVKSHNSNIKLEMLPKFREFLDRVAFKAEE